MEAQKAYKSPHKSSASESEADSASSTKYEEAEAEAQVSDADGVENSTQAELTKIPLMRAAVEAKDPSAKEADDLMIRRFLRARDLDIEKASAMFLKFLKWRRSFVPNGFVSESEIPNELAHEKVYVQGVDKLGRPIIVAFGAKHYQNPDGVDEFRRLVTYILEKVCSRIPPGQEKFVAIADLKGWRYANSDVRGYLAALSILQDYYPERLGKLFIVHASSIFMTVWKMIYPFIDNKTKKKITFVEKSKIKSTLMEEIDESQIPETYGGQLPLVPIQDS
ncbi:phosphatidylinositol transfer protein 3 [Neltuma alba]|uniref:phosphatidylinositol transfer protein 3 n=1 Tax=Neltuma alba TaxID=207710 RepID=UPI0010A2FAAE|nr:phosphatidylinositol transfer protein 3-like [Prosopis alba]